MKNSSFFTLALLAATFTLSCTREMAETAAQNEEGLVEMSFKAGSDTDSKTSLNSDKNIVWTSGDRLSVFDGWHNRCFTTSDAGLTAIFKGFAQPSADHYAIYPYNETFKMSAPAVFDATVPYSQVVAAGSFGEGANLAVGKAEDGVFHMKNVCGYIRLDITGCTKNVASITLDAGEGNYLAGGVEIDFTTGIPSVKSTDGVRRLTLHPVTGTWLGNGSYYAVAVPGVSVDSITVKLISDEGYIARLKTAGISVARNTDKNSRLALNLADVSWASPATNEIYLRFIVDSTQKLNQPFTPDITRIKDGSVAANVDGEYSLNDYPGYNFYLRFTANSCKFNSNTGFNFGGLGDYIKFPTMVGKSLKRVDVKFYTAGADQSVSLRDDNGIIAGGEPKANPCASGDTVAFIPTTPVANVAYTLYKENANDARIHFIRLVYSGLDLLQVSKITLGESEILDGELSVDGSIEVVNPDAGTLTWGLEYYSAKAQTWNQFAKGSGQTISGTLSEIEVDTLNVRAWAKADDDDKVYSSEKVYVWKHPSIESINVKMVKVKNCKLTVSAEVLGSDLDKGVVKWGIDYRCDTTAQWSVGPCDEGAVIDTAFTVPADSVYLRIWAQGDNRSVVYSDVIFAKIVPVNVRSVSVTKATLRKGKLKFAGLVTADNPTAGDITWGLQYRAPGTSAWTEGPTGTGAQISDSLSSLTLDEAVVRLWAQADGKPAVYSDTLKAKSKLTVSFAFNTSNIEYVKTYGMGANGDSVAVDPSFPTPLPTSSNTRTTVRPLPYDKDGKSDAKKAAWDEFNIKAYSVPFKIEGSYSGAQGRCSVNYNVTSDNGLKCGGSFILAIPGIEGYVLSGFEFYSSSAKAYVLAKTASSASSKTITIGTPSSDRLQTVSGGTTICGEAQFTEDKPTENVEYYLWLLGAMEIRNVKYIYEVCE